MQERSQTQSKARAGAASGAISVLGLAFVAWLTGTAPPPEAEISGAVMTLVGLVVAPAVGYLVTYVAPRNRDK